MRDLDLHPDAKSDDDVVEISDAEPGLNSPLHVELPEARDWSSPTFACHRHVLSCVLSAACPCVQFGLNQRMAFKASCVLWALLWLAPVALLWFAMQRYADQAAALGSAHVEAAVMMAQSHVEHVKAHVRGHLRRGIKGHTEPAVPVLTPTVAQPEHHAVAFVYFVPAALCLVGLLGAVRRAKLRNLIGIRGSWVADFVCHCCCMCCSIAKEARECRRQAFDEVVAEAHGDLTIDDRIDV